MQGAATQRHKNIPNPLAVQQPAQIVDPLEEPRDIGSKNPLLFGFREPLARFERSPLPSRILLARSAMRAIEHSVSTPVSETHDRRARYDAGRPEVK